MDTDGYTRVPGYLLLNMGEGEWTFQGDSSF